MLFKVAPRWPRYILQNQFKIKGLLLFTPKATATDVSKDVDGYDSFCKICSIKHGSAEDFICESPWLGCSEETCHFWAHATCLGIECDNESVSYIGNFWCQNHRRKITAVKRKLIES